MGWYEAIKDGLKIAQQIDNILILLLIMNQIGYYIAQIVGIQIKN